MPAKGRISPVADLFFMTNFLAYPLGVSGWRLAVHLGVPLRTVVPVSFSRETGLFEALCTAFGNEDPVAASAESVEQLQEKLNAEFSRRLQAAFKRELLMPPQLHVTLSLVARNGAASSGKGSEPASAMLPRCCSARQFVK